MAKEMIEIDSKGTFMPKKILEGVIVSDKQDKTVVVRVEKKFKHCKYKKLICKHRKYAVHDPENQYKVGDSVKIVESRPISRTKRWCIAG